MKQNQSVVVLDGKGLCGTVNVIAEMKKMYMLHIFEMEVQNHVVAFKEKKQKEEDN